jgi:hypothetical protein
MVGSLGSSFWYKRFLPCLGCYDRPSTKYFFRTINQCCESMTFWVRIRIRIRGSMPLTNGSGSRSRKPKNMRIRRIRIRNTAVNYFNSFFPIAQQAGQAVVQGRLSLSLCLCSSHWEKKWDHTGFILLGSAAPLFLCPGNSPHSNSFFIVPTIGPEFLDKTSRAHNFHAIVCTYQRGQCNCRLYPSSPQPPRQCLAPTCHLSTLLTLYCRCGLAYLYDWRGFVGAKKKTSMGLSVFNSSMYNLQVQCCS